MWTLRRLQDQAFNMAVEMALALEPAEPVPKMPRKAARAVRRLERHIVAGTKRLYRSRKRIARTGGPALIVLDGARLEGDAIVLPAARGEAPLRLSLADRSFEVSDGWE